MKTHQSTEKQRWQRLSAISWMMQILRKKRKITTISGMKMKQILEEFGLDTSTGKIVNGHMPVAVKKGESPIKCGGKLFVIDGGFSKAYQKTTGIAGYTLVSNSYGLKLVAHEPFVSRTIAIREETDIHSDTIVINKVTKRKCVMDTDNGKALQEKVADLEQLLWAYQKGLITERI